MELNDLKGNIIGIIAMEMQNEEDFKDKKVSEIIKFKLESSLKMVGLAKEIESKAFSDLSSREKSKVILASKLNDEVIVLKYFSKGLISKDIEDFKRLFKKLVSYNKKIILIDNNLNLFLNCVDNIYIISENEIIYETKDIYDPTLYLNMDAPGIVDFTYLSEDEGIHIDEYKELDELIKAIYRIKS